MKIPELEKKLRTQKTKFEKELKGMETFYTEKIKNISSTQGKSNLEILSLTRERHRDLSRDKSNDHSKTICNEDPDRVNVN